MPKFRSQYEPLGIVLRVDNLGEGLTLRARTLWLRVEGSGLKSLGLSCFAWSKMV